MQLTAAEKILFGIWDRKFNALEGEEFGREASGFLAGGNPVLNRLLLPLKIEYLERKIEKKTFMEESK